MCCGDEMQQDEDACSMHSAADAGYNTYDQDYSGGEESGTEDKEEGRESIVPGTKEVLDSLCRNNCINFGAAHICVFQICIS